MSWLVVYLTIFINLSSKLTAERPIKSSNSETKLVKFNTFEKTVTGHRYVYTKEEVKTHSLDEAMRKCPEGTRLLTIHHEGIEQDLLKMAHVTGKGKFLLAMSSKMDMNIWMYSHSLCMYSVLFLLVLLVFVPLNFF